MENETVVERVIREEKQKKQKNRKIAIIVVIVLVVIGIIASHSDTNNKSNNNSSTNIKTDSTIIDTTKTNASTTSTVDNWTYSEDNSDKMDNSVVKFAACTATDKLEFKFPYEGGSTLTITLRHGFKKKGNEVYITVDKGQFVSGDLDNSVVRVKFDDGKPIPFNYSESSSGTSGLIFINDPSLFIQKLKNSKHIVFEANYYDEGIKQSEFNTSGLKW
jgi:hypothetical protein